MKLKKILEYFICTLLAMNVAYGGVQHLALPDGSSVEYQVELPQTERFPLVTLSQKINCETLLRVGFATLTVTQNGSEPVQDYQPILTHLQGTKTFSERWNGATYDQSQFLPAPVLTSTVIWLLVQEDQRLIERLMQVYKSNPQSEDPRLIELNLELKARINLDLTFIKQLFHSGEFPLISTHGLETSKNAWLLVQHADHDVAFQKEVLHFLEAAHTRGDVFAANVAYLKDRVAVNEASARGEVPVQYFGTQGHGVAGVWEPYSIHDRARVDELRAEYGLGPLEDYIQKMNQL